MEKEAFFHMSCEGVSSWDMHYITSLLCCIGEELTPNN